MLKHIDIIMNLEMKGVWNRANCVFGRADFPNKLWSYHGRDIIKVVPLPPSETLVPFSLAYSQGLCKVRSLTHPIPNFIAALTYFTCGFKFLLLQVISESLKNPDR